MVLTIQVFESVNNYIFEIQSWLFIVVSLLLGSCTPLSAQSPLTGNWEGYIEIQGTRLTIKTHFSEAQDSVSGTIDIPQQGAAGLPLRDIETPGDSVAFSFQAGPGLAVFKGHFTSDQQIKGTFYQRGMSFPFQLSRASQNEKPLPYQQKELTIRNGDLTIGGTLTLPGGTDQAPCVLLLSGSGAQDRNATAYGFEIFRHLADYLTRNGIAVFRYDDRGVGQSTGSLADASLDDLAADVQTIIKDLKTQSSINPNQIGLLGHSQGGVVAGKVAAQQNTPIRFLILMASPARPLSEVVVDQVKTLLKEQGAADSVIQQQVALQRAVFDTLRNSQNFDKIRVPLEENVLQKINSLPESAKASIPDPKQYAANQIDHQLNALTSASYRSFLDYDPVTDLKNSGVPVLAVYGGKDQQVLSDINALITEKALKKAERPYQIKVFPDANHLFQEAQTGSISEYGQLDKAFVEGFSNTIVEWIKKNTKN